MASLIHASSIVSPRAVVGKNVKIGPFCLIHDNVIIGDDSTIESYCELGVSSPLTDGSPLIIGNSSYVRSHSVFYESSVLGDGLTTGHRVTVREKTIAGLSFQIGTSTEIQGDCQIGNYVRFQSNIFVGKGSTIGNFVWVLPYVVLTNDPTPPSDILLGCTLSDYVTLCASSIILPGVIIGARSVVAASACVTKNVPPDVVVAGVPAKILCEARNVIRRDGSGLPAYPWIKHFKRGYPASVVKNWNFDE